MYIRFRTCPILIQSPMCKQFCQDCRKNKATWLMIEIFSLHKKIPKYHFPAPKYSIQEFLKLKSK